MSEQLDIEKANMTPLKYRKEEIQKVYVDKNTGEEFYDKEKLREHCTEKARNWESDTNEG